MSTFESVIDMLKFAAGLADRVYADLGAADAGDPKSAATAIEAALCRSKHVDAVLRQAVSMCCPHCVANGNMNRYDDGREVTSTIALDEHTHYSRVWHPKAAHQINLQCNNIGTVTLRDGVRKRVIVAAPGVLDAVTVSEPSRSTDGNADLGHTAMRWPRGFRSDPTPTQ
jgi:hypothetical protein